jgi:hypothetical protein
MTLRTCSPPNGGCSYFAACLHALLTLSSEDDPVSYGDVHYTFELDLCVPISHIRQTHPLVVIYVLIYVGIFSS